MDGSHFHDILKRYWGYEDFRPLQLEIIESIASGRDTLGLMPTGGGKSLTFQVPALASDGICLVVTPLVALMKDQVSRLRQMGIKAACIHSGMPQNEIVLTLDNCLYGNYKFLYVSPERLSTQLFLERILSLQVSMLVVDEAHCISQWGYDFRPSYLNIADIRLLLPDVPVLALTATATPEVVADIQERLRFPEPNALSMSFERQNLSYVVRNTDDKEKTLLSILSSVPGTALVYVRMRATTKEISDNLRKLGISADYYHAGLTEDVKNQKQQQWQEGKTRVIVSTNAFGMGIDKADVRVVVHWDLPDSPEAYFQEAGRAGRDRKKAYAVLLYQKADAVRLKKRISDTFPEKKYIRKVYDCLCYYYELEIGTGAGAVYPFDSIEFSRRFHLNEVQVFSALKLLQQAGYIEYEEPSEGTSKVMMAIDRDELYNISLDEDDEELLGILLRSYTGLFADAVHIEEERLAERVGKSRDEVYQGLLRLSRQGIIDYIPRKKSPLVKIVMDRVEGKDIPLTQVVYEDRRRRYEERIQAMIEYAADDSVCRSKRLMHYFGQQNARNCGICDVCLKKNEQGIRTWETDEITDAVKVLLSDGKSLPLETLVDSLVNEEVGVQKPCTIGGNTLRGHYSADKVITILRFLCSKGVLKQENFRYLLV